MIRTGIDIVKISKVAELIKKDENFTSKILTDAEVEYCESKQVNGNLDKKYQTLAGLYAVKEAVLKALGVGITKLTYFKQIEVAHNELNKPYLNTFGEVNEIFCTLGVAENDISISHDGEYAIAICVLK